MRREYSSDDIAGWVLPPGRGYARQETDNFRAAAVAAVKTLETRLENARAEIEAQTTSPTPRLDIMAIARSLAPEELQKVGLTAIGLELVEARQAAREKERIASRRASKILAEARDRLLTAANTLPAANAQFTADQLRLAIGEAVEKLGLSGASSGTTPNSPAIKLFR
jgi:hypothetical protein